MWNLSYELYDNICECNIHLFVRYLYVIIAVCCSRCVFGKKGTIGIIVASPLFAISLGLYQSFIQVAILLYMFLIIADLVYNKHYLNVIKSAVVYVSSLIIGLLIYFVGYKKAVLALTGLATIESYNSPLKLTDFGKQKEIISLITGTYKYVVHYFWNPSIFNDKIMAVLTLILFAYSVYALCYISHKNKVCLINNSNFPHLKGV